MMKTLNDFPEYVEIHDAVQRAQLELQRITERRAEIQTTLLSMKQPKEEVDDEWDIFKIGGTAGCCTAETELREEYAALDQREQFVIKALAQGRQELDRVHGRCSLEICQAHRPQFVDEIRKILEAVKAICEANRALDTMRSDLEGQGVRTGSLAAANFEIGGNWNDEYGGRVVGYQRYIAEFYPELAGAAGQGVKGKLRELAEKTRSFVGGEHEHTQS